MSLTHLQSKAHSALFVTSSVFSRPAWGNNHPLAIPRQSAMIELCTSLGLLGSSNTIPCKAASMIELSRFHDPEYIKVFHQADMQKRISSMDREKYKIGTMENPLFPGLFERAATTVGGSILAAQSALEGRIVFHPGGGTHHGKPAQASGFCYFNDPVFALLELLEAGLSRIAYVDIDAHHGDGVEDAFWNEPRVRTYSIHEENRWPHSGNKHDPARPHAQNYPVPRGIRDIGYQQLADEKLMPALADFAPESIVITCGADALDGDPLSGMCLGNRQLINTTLQLCNLAPSAIVLGGGGYNPWTTARLWTALWAQLSQQAIPEPLPQHAQEILEGLTCDLVDEEDMLAVWTSSLLDPPQT